MIRNIRFKHIKSCAELYNIYTVLTFCFKLFWLIWYFSFYGTITDKKEVLIVCLVQRIGFNYNILCNPIIHRIQISITLAEQTHPVNYGFKTKQTSIIIFWLNKPYTQLSWLKITYIFMLFPLTSKITFLLW